MRNLSVFDENFDLIREPSEDILFDLAVEISKKLKGKLNKISADAEELLYIERGRMRGPFIKLMLFVDADIELIADVMDIKEELVVAYRELFFDTSLIRGELGKTELYEDIFAEEEEGTPEFDFGIMLRDAHLGGPDIVMAQFNIEPKNYSSTDFKDREQQLMMWRLKQTDRGDRNYEALKKEIDARKAVIAGIKEAASTDNKSELSDIGHLNKILEDIVARDLGRKEKFVRSFDTKTEEVIEAEVMPVSEITHKKEENK